MQESKQQLLLLIVMVIMLLLRFFVMLIFFGDCVLNSSANLMSLLRLGWKVTKPPRVILSTETCNILTMTLVFRYGCARFLSLFKCIQSYLYYVKEDLHLQQSCPSLQERCISPELNAKSSTPQSSIPFPRASPNVMKPCIFSFVETSHFFVLTPFSLLWKPQKIFGKGKRAETSILPPR